MLALIAFALLGQNPDDTLKERVIQVCQCQFGGECVCGAACQCELATYRNKSRLAYAQNKSLIVFVGCKARPIEGAVVVEMRYFEGDKTPRIIPAWREGDWFSQPSKPLGHKASDDEIRRAARITARRSADTTHSVGSFLRPSSAPPRFYSSQANC